MKLIDLRKMNSIINTVSMAQDTDLTKTDTMFSNVEFSLKIGVEDFSHGQNVQRDLRKLIEDYIKNYGQEEPID